MPQMGGALAFIYFIYFLFFVVVSNTYDQCACSSENLARPMRTVHRRGPFKCECGAEFVKKYDMKHHTKTECPRWSEPCECCNHRFSTPSNLKKHIRDNTTKKLKPSNNYFKPLPTDPTVSNLIN